MTASAAARLPLPCTPSAVGSPEAGPPSSASAAAGSPDGTSLLALERHARQRGSGIEHSGLLGCWRLETVWPRSGERPAALSSALLRGLGARLSLAAADGAELEIRNSVALGALELCFRGQARLEGRRPLLLFRFERLQLRLGALTLLDRPIAQSQPFATSGAAQLPFFALIATEPGAGWLAARGRGGGLALWRRSGATLPARLLPRS